MGLGRRMEVSTGVDNVGRGGRGGGKKIGVGNDTRRNRGKRVSD